MLACPPPPFHSPPLQALDAQLASAGKAAVASLTAALAAGPGGGPLDDGTLAVSAAVLHFLASLYDPPGRAVDTGAGMGPTAAATPAPAPAPAPADPVSPVLSPVPAPAAQEPLPGSGKALPPPVPPCPNSVWDAPLLQLVTSAGLRAGLAAALCKDLLPRVCGRGDADAHPVLDAVVGAVVAGRDGPSAATTHGPHVQWLHALLRLTHVVDRLVGREAAGAGAWRTGLRPVALPAVHALARALQASVDAGHPEPIRVRLLKVWPLCRAAARVCTCAACVVGVAWRRGGVAWRRGGVSWRREASVDGKRAHEDMCGL
jgi:hypothetical protein